MNHTTTSYKRLAAIIAIALWLAGCAAAQTKKDSGTAAKTEQTTTATKTTATKAAGPSVGAKTPCAGCAKSECQGCDKAKVASNKSCGADCTKPCCAGGHAAEGFKLITAEQLKDKMQGAAQVHVVDVNNDKRWAKGRIAGSKHILRDNLSEETLPTNKAATLVFYCYSAKCMSSHKAARVAIGLGYTNVWVMSDGITGWESKGLKTEQ